MITLELPGIMSVNGLKNHEKSSMETIIRRMKFQVCLIKELEDRGNEAAKENAIIRERIRNSSSESDRLVSILKTKSEKCTKEIKFFLSPPVRRAAPTIDRDTSSPCLLSNPFNPSIPPPSAPNAPNSSIRSLLSVKRVFSNNINLCAAAVSSSPPTLSYSPSGTPTMDTADFTSIPLDPSIDIILNRFRRSLQTSEAQINSNQAELQRSKFTQDSQNGKRMMSRVRVLEAENEELERQKESGRPGKVSSLISLRQNFIDIIKRTNENIERRIDEAESETEVFTSTLVMLQQQLSLSRTTVEVLGVALEATGAKFNGHSVCASLFAKAKWPLPDSLAYLADVRQSLPSPVKNMNETISPKVLPPKTTKLEEEFLTNPLSVEQVQKKVEKELEEEVTPPKIPKLAKIEEKMIDLMPCSSPELPTVSKPCSPPPPSIHSQSPIKHDVSICRDPRILRYRT